MHSKANSSPGQRFENQHCGEPHSQSRPDMPRGGWSVTRSINVRLHDLDILHIPVYKAQEDATQSVILGDGVMKFDVAGPFELSRQGPKQIIKKNSLKKLKADLEDWETGLSDACGCYVFTLRAGKGYTPYYIGKSSKRGIAEEALNPSNREKYNEALGDSKGRPMLFVIPMLTPEGRFRKKMQGDGSLEAIDFLEQWLIATAIEKNRDLINNKQTRFLRNIHVAGTFNGRRGEATTASRLLNKALW
jgi:hypothetical protein